MTKWVDGKVRLIGAVFTLVLGAGCSDGSEQPVLETDTDEGYVNGDLLHSIPIGENHVLEFYEFRDGQLAVRESQPIGSTSVLDGVRDAEGLSSVFRRVRPEVVVPSAIIEAERRASKAPAMQETLDEAAPLEEIRAEVEREALDREQAEPVQTRAATCSGDVLGDQWGADWFTQNHCNFACSPGTWIDFSKCDTNWGYAFETARGNDWLYWRQFEGDFNVAGRIRAWSLKPARVIHFDRVLPPRQMETWWYKNNGSSSTTNVFWGDSPCGHLGRNTIRCD